MRKLESFYNVKSESNFTSQSELEIFYLDLVSPNVNPYSFKKPYDNLIEYKDKLEFDGKKLSFEYCFTKLLIKHFEKIILMNPQTMQRIIRMMEFTKLSLKFYRYNKVSGKIIKTEFCEKLIDLLRYNDAIGGGSRGKDLARSLNIKACLYCNAQYSFSYKYDSKKISKLQLDHFFAKSKYPYFSISLYNLIPCCSYCNQKKSDAPFTLKTHYHPYIDSLCEKFKFTLSEKSDKKLLLNYKISEKDVDIILEHDPLDKKLINHKECFDLQGIYNNHKDIVIDILKKGKAYSKFKRNDILNIKDENGNLLFQTEEDFMRSFFNFPLKEFEINNMPLAKLKRDFALRANIVLD